MTSSVRVCCNNAQLSTNRKMQNELSYFIGDCWYIKRNKLRISSFCKLMQDLSYLEKQDAKILVIFRLYCNVIVKPMSLQDDRICFVLYLIKLSAAGIVRRKVTLRSILPNQGRRVLSSNFKMARAQKREM